MTPERFQRLQAVLDRRQPDLTVLMEGVHKPHNLAAVLRSCDAVGVLEAHAVAPAEGFSAPHLTSGGSAKWVPVRMHPATGEAVDWLHARGFRVLAAHPAADAVDYRRAGLAEPVAFLLGTELYGVSDEALAAADGAVSLPMAGMVRSLNVSVAAALLLYEAYRQRDAAGMYDAPRLDPERYRRILFRWAHPRVAAECRRRGLPYPALDAEGEIVELPPELAGGERPTPMG